MAAVNRVISDITIMISDYYGTWCGPCGSCRFGESELNVANSTLSWEN